MTVANISLVLGQSNAIGFGTYDGVTFTPYPGGWTVDGTKDRIWNAAYGWGAYAPGVNSNNYIPSPNPPGYINVAWGPEASIAAAKRAASSPVQTNIFKYALGGVGLAQNQGQRGAHPSGYSWSPHGGSLFTNFCTDLATACAQLVTAGLTPCVKEVFWIGNESDCFDWASAASIEHDLPAFIAAIRARQYCSGAKFIIARTKATLGSAAGPLPYVDIVRYNQEAATWGDASVVFVNCDDLVSGGVSAGHYDGSGLVTMGTRLAGA
jgi:hypothetical protein